MNEDMAIFACVSIASELPMHAQVILDDEVDGECGTTLAPTLDAVGFECGSLLAVGYEIDLTLPGVPLTAGDRYIVAFPNDLGDINDSLFEGAACGGDGMTTLGNNYLLEVSLADTFEECFPVEADGACCLPNPVGSTDPCVFLSEADCTTAGGTFGGAGSCCNEVCLPVTCPADIDGNGDVGFDDLLRVLSQWTTPDCIGEDCPSGNADINCVDGVGFDDLLQVLNQWGPCP